MASDQQDSPPRQAGSGQRGTPPLIIDAPSGSDAFESGAHAKVANVIASLVLGDGPGRSIGLQGKWGAGKSTVVEIARAGIENGSKDAAVLIFDAWAHQGDPLRRSFLETLIGLLEERKWIGSELAKNKRHEVAGDTKHIHRSNGTHLTLTGMLTLVAAALVPLLLLVANEALDGFRVRTGSEQLWTVAIVLTILLVPVAPTLGSLAITKIRGSRGGDASSWSLVATGSDITETTETIEGGEPTSIEFERIFDEVVRAALAKNPTRRLLIVFDNLDRVDADDAKAVLAALQTFTAHRSDKDDALHHVWTMIPYDPDGLARIWSPGPHPSDDTANQEVRKQFEDKVFQVMLSDAGLAGPPR